jgi:hypothetical protein
VVKRKAILLLSLLILVCVFVIGLSNASVWKKPEFSFLKGRSIANYELKGIRPHNVALNAEVLCKTEIYYYDLHMPARTVIKFAAREDPSLKYTTVGDQTFFEHRRYSMRLVQDKKDANQCRLYITLDTPLSVADRAKSNLFALRP